MNLPEKVLVFEIDGQPFAADVAHIREVLRAPNISPMPRTRPPVKGIFNLRGSVVTAVDGADAMGLAGHRPSTRQMAVVAHAGSGLVGVLVDAAIEVRAIGPEDVRSAEGVGELRGEAVQGIVLLDDRPVVLVDLARLVPKTATPETGSVHP